MTEGSRGHWPVDIVGLDGAAVAARLWHSTASSQSGGRHVTFVVKTLLRLVPDGRATVLPGAEIVSKDRHYRDSPARSVELSGELAPYLARCDVTLKGSAHAPAGQTVVGGVVRLAVVRGAPLFDKRLHVFGDRDAANPAPQAAKPFQSIPVDYEHAFGGKSNRDNPVGRGADKSGATAAPPNIVDPVDPTRVAGFAPLSRFWGQRARLLGSVSRQSLDAEEPSIADGFDWSFFQAAPPDQQVPYLVGDEWIVFDGMHPVLTRVASQLPAIRGAALMFVHDGTSYGPGEPIRLAADMLAIDAEQLIASIVWRGSTLLARHVDPKRIKILGAVHVDGSPIPWPNPRTLDAPGVSSGIAGPPSAPVSSETAFVDPARALRAASGVTPFSPSAEAIAPEASPVSANALSGETITVGVPAPPHSPTGVAAKPATPMAPPPQDLEGTMAVSPQAALRAVAPFAIQEAGSSRSPAAPIQGAPWAQSAPGTAQPIAPPPPSQPIAPPPVAPPSQRFAPPPIAPPPIAPVAPPSQRFAPPPIAPPPISSPPIAPAPVAPPPAFAPPVAPAPAAPPSSKAPVDLEQTFRLSRRAAEAASEGPAVPFKPSDPDAAPFLVGANTPNAPQILEPVPVPPRAASAAAEPDFGSTMAIRPGDAARFLEALAPFPIARPRPRQERKEGVPHRESPQIPITNVSPLSAATTPWQIKPPQDITVVIVKATFDIGLDAHAKATLKQREEPDPLLGDTHVDEDLERTLLYPSDFAILKPRADVVFNGHAFGGQASSVDVSIKLGSGVPPGGFSRTMRVFGDRLWHSGRLTEPSPFEKLPITFEKAFGGTGSHDNPLGTGVGGTRPPNQEDPRALIRTPTDAPAAVSWGPLPTTWRERAAKLGTYDDVWFKTRWPYYPVDFDWSHCQSAPSAQQVNHLAGDETFSVSGMHAEHATIQGALPGLRVRAFRYLATEELLEIPLVLDTVVFDLDEMKVNLVWRGNFDASDDEAPEVETLFIHQENMRDAALELPAVKRLLLRAASPEPDEETQIEDGPALPKKTEQELEMMRNHVEGLLGTGAPLDGVDMSEAILTGLDFSGKSLVGANLKEAVLANCRLTGANLSEAVLAGSDLTGCDLHGANLQGADLVRARLDGANLDETDVNEADFSMAQAAGATFRKARGASVQLAGAVLSKARFDGAEMPSADFTQAKLDGAHFNGAKMPEIKLYYATGEGSCFDKAELDEARCDDADLVKSSFVEARAPSSTWEKAFLAGSTFARSTLTGSSFARARCEGVNFSAAEAAETRFARTKLDRAQFVKANLMACDFERADLSNADLRGANLHDAETLKAKLDRAKLDLALVSGTKLETPRS